MGKYAILFSSKTGNTKMLAELIREELPLNECSYFGEITDENIEGEVVFVGFWTDKGSCDDNVKEYLNKLIGKKVFLFGTAGFGKDESYFDSILKRVEENLNDNSKLVGSFMCQGKMPIGVRKRYEAMMETNPSKAKELLDNFDNGVSHPNKDDLMKLKEKIKDVIKVI